MENNELEKKVLDLELKLEEDKKNREFTEKIEQEKKVNNELLLKLKEKDDLLKFILITVIVSVLIILIGFYIIPNLKSNHNTPNSKVDILGAGIKDDKFENIDLLFFNNVLDKDISKDLYTNIWGKENISFSDREEINIFYPKGSYSPSSNPRGGAGFIYKLGKNLDKAKLSYKVKFDNNFDFVKGGKLPGFCSGDCPRGGSNSGTDFSTRFMWRAKGDIEIYAYLPTNTSTYGKSFGKGTFRFVPGKYYKIEQTIKLNTPGKNDGEMIMYVDNSEVFRDNKVVFRESKNVFIDSIIFSTFFGGSDTSWATPNGTNTYFKDFTLSY